MYSPRIEEKFVREMYRRKQTTGKNLVQQANEAIEAYLAAARRIEAVRDRSASEGYLNVTLIGEERAPVEMHVNVIEEARPPVRMLVVETRSDCDEK